MLGREEDKEEEEGEKREGEFRIYDIYKLRYIIT